MERIKVELKGSEVKNKEKNTLHYSTEMELGGVALLLINPIASVCRERERERETDFR